MSEAIVWHRLVRGAATHAVPSIEFWHGTDDPSRVTCPICLAQMPPTTTPSSGTSPRESES